MSSLLKALKGRNSGPTYRHRLILADDRLITQRSEYVAELEDLQFDPPNQDPLVPSPKRRYGQGSDSSAREDELQKLIDGLDEQIAEDTYEVVFRALSSEKYDQVVEEISHFEDDLPENPSKEDRQVAKGKDYEAVALELAKRSFVELTRAGVKTDDGPEEWATSLGMLPPSERAAILSQMFPLHMNRVDIPKSSRSSGQKPPRAEN